MAPSDNGATVNIDTDIQITLDPETPEGSPVEVKAVDADGTKVGESATPSPQGVVYLLEITAQGISSLFISGGGNEGLLIDLCAYRETGDQNSKENKKKCCNNDKKNQ